MKCLLTVLLLLLLVCVAKGELHEFKSREFMTHPDIDPDQEHPTDIWLFKLHKNANPVSVASRLGMEYLHSLAGGKYFAFRQKERTRHDMAYVERVSRMAATDPNVRWYQKQMARQQFKRSGVATAREVDEGAKNENVPYERYFAERYGPDVTARIERKLNNMTTRADDGCSRNVFTPVDPYFYKQWHLQPGSPSNVRSTDTWDRDVSYRGNGATIAIVDDGVEYEHPDIAARFQPSLSYSFNDNTMNVQPYITDKHGTACAGVAAAASNAVCGVGACPECNIAGIKLIAGPSSDYLEALGLSHKDKNITVYSCSWGPMDDGKRMIKPGPATRAAIARNARLCRDGRGAIYVWAGGNGARNNDNVNYDGYANNRNVIAVGAVNYDGVKSYYSEEGAALTAVAPSSGTYSKGITTTFFTTQNLAACTSGFGGTSSSAPLTAGAIGTMLGKYPNLTRRDVVGIIAKSAKKIDPRDSDWTPTVRGHIHHNHKYGFGVIDMYEMTRQAILWQMLPAEISCRTGRRAFNYFLSDAGGDYNWNIRMPYGRNNCKGGKKIKFVEQVEVRVWVSHRSRGDLRITLTGPDRVASRLHLPHADPNAYPSDGWTYMSMRHYGRPLAGMWDIAIGDHVRNGVSGHLLGLELIVYGH